MLKECCAGICGGGVWSPPRYAGDQDACCDERRPDGPNGPKFGAAAAPAGRTVVKPIRALDEPETPDWAASFEGLIERFGMVPAPPQCASAPKAVVSADYTRNADRVVVLLPSSDARPGTWDTGLRDRGAVLPLLRWAQANGHSVALFHAEALQASPGKVFDEVLRGSPAKYASILVAGGQLPVLQAALEPLHSLLFARFKTVVVHFQDMSALRAPPQTLPKDLRQHLSQSLVREPAKWESLCTFAMHEELFRLIQQREDHWGAFESTKCQGIANMQENDVPGLRRLNTQQRLDKLDRNRDDDELAQLLKKHEKDTGCGSGDDEPGVD